MESVAVMLGGAWLLQNANAERQENANEKV